MTHTVPLAPAIYALTIERFRGIFSLKWKPSRGVNVFLGGGDVGLAQESLRPAEHRARLKEAGLGHEEIKRVIDPIESFHLQLREEVEAYERLKRGEFAELDDLRAVGHLLITSRIAQGIFQRELARRLGVHASHVSRDERNEYFGITLERAAKILDVLNVRLHTKIAIDPLPLAPVAQAS